MAHSAHLLDRLEKRVPLVLKLGTVSTHTGYCEYSQGTHSAHLLDRLEQRGRVRQRGVAFERVIVAQRPIDRC